VPFHVSTAVGEDAVAFAADCGLILDEWQSWSLMQSMGTRADGHWTAFEVAWIIPRQNGKNSGLEARQLAGLFMLREALQIHTAHEFKASSEHFLRMQSTIRGNPELLRQVKPNGIRTSHGEEAIELRPKPTLIFGAMGTQIRRSVAPRLRFLARSRGSGRSFTCDALYYDEAMILSDEEVSASMPTMSAVANPQMWYTASAGHPDSWQLGAVRNRGIAGTDHSLVFLEWSVEFCPELCPYRNQPYCPAGHDRRGDPRSWARANPGMGIRISEEHIAREHDKMPAAGFDRERLGIGDWPVEDMSYSVISQHHWDACIWPDGEMPRPPRIAVWVDITPDQSAACIAIAGLLPGEPAAKKGDPPPERKCTLEIGSDGTWDDHRAGVDWIIPRLKELKLRNKVAVIGVDPVGPGAELLVAIEKEPDLAAVMETCQLRDVAQAHAQFLRGLGVPQAGDGAEPVRTIFHRDQEAMRKAVAAAVQRDVGDGMHAWSRKNTTHDISPLCAGTMAVWAARKFGRGYDVLRSVM
jgi:hypothetical protein